MVGYMFQCSSAFHSNTVRLSAEYSEKTVVLEKYESAKLPSKSNEQRICKLLVLVGGIGCTRSPVYYLIVAVGAEE
jgi:hypothetical protein